MFDDIRPPQRKAAVVKPHQPMRSQRLRGHSIDGAKTRLTSAPEPATPVPAITSLTPLAAKPSSISPAPPQDPKHPKKQRFMWWRRLNRNLRFAIIAFLLLIFGAGAVYYYKHITPEAETTFAIVKHKKVPPKPKTIASPLTGVQVDPTLAARPVTGIMIENSDEARPQSGIQEAGVVVEAIAEGGITRFLTLFQDTSPQYVGPVRSLRPYYLDFAAPFQASIVHVGGSAEALSQVRNGNYRDLDQFFNSTYFTRITARYAPHNVYTGFDRLDKLNQAKGYTASKFISWPRKIEKPLKVATAKTIQFAISSPYFYANYSYDTATNSYLRSEGGAPHLEYVNSGDTTGTQLHPKVVIALIMNHGIEADGQHSVYADTGTGNAFIFQDGGVTPGTWSKAGRDDQISFLDSTGKALKLNAGQTWISLVGADNQVTYNP